VKTERIWLKKSFGTDVDTTERAQEVGDVGIFGAVVRTELLLNQRDVVSQ
jgi:hypothetical protein